MRGPYWAMSFCGDRKSTLIQDADALERLADDEEVRQLALDIGKAVDRLGIHAFFRQRLSRFRSFEPKLYPNDVRALESVIAWAARLGETGVLGTVPDVLLTPQSRCVAHAVYSALRDITDLPDLDSYRSLSGAVAAAQTSSDPEEVKVIGRGITNVVRNMIDRRRERSLGEELMRERANSRNSVLILMAAGLVGCALAIAARANQKTLIEWAKATKTRVSKLWSGGTTTTS